MADSQIVSSAVADAQSVYELQGGVRFILKAVNADFADNGAATAWLPAVVIGSDSGNVIARAVDQAVQVAAGSDAACSFFPGVKHVGGGSTALDNAWCFAEGNLAMNGGTPTYFTFVTNDPTVYDNLGPVSGRIRILAPGTYLLFPYSEWTTTTGAPVVTTRVLFGCNLSFAGGGFSHETVHDGFLALGTNDVTGVAGHFVWQARGVLIVNMQAASPPAEINLQAGNSSASNLGSADTALTIVRIAVTPFAGVF